MCDVILKLNLKLKKIKNKNKIKSIIYNSNNCITTIFA